jgi:ABC-type glutathione transport system ATPase component
MSAAVVAASSPAVVQIEGLSLAYTGSQRHQALRDVSLTVAAGDVLAIIGETGSGKSTLVHSVLGLLPSETETSGTIRVTGGDGADIEPLELNPAEAALFRREQVGFVPQLTQRALVPVLSVERHFRQFADRLPAGQRDGWRDRAEAALAEIGLADPPRVLSMYPHQLSGGMAQRVCIALAMFGTGMLVVADEPTSGLDALVRRRVADLLGAELAGTSRAMLLVTHDLALARRLSTRVLVLYRGQVVEAGPTEQFFTAPQHQYSQTLVAAVPRPGEPLAADGASSAEEAVS